MPACRQAGIERLPAVIMVFVYAIKSLKDGRIYIGQTIDLLKRIKEHNKGLSKSTSYYKPWFLIYSEETVDRQKARMREKYLKSGFGKRIP